MEPIIGVVIVVVMRMLCALVILRYKTVGIILTMVADYLDLQILRAFGGGDLVLYQYLDKAIDFCTLGVEFYVSLQWSGVFAKKISKWLFVHRAIGMILFEITQIRQLLILFPNVIEYFVLYYVAYTELKGHEPDQSPRKLLMATFYITVFKIFHEILLHNGVVDFWFYYNKYVEPYTLENLLKSVIRF